MFLYGQIKRLPLKFKKQIKSFRSFKNSNIHQNSIYKSDNNNVLRQILIINRYYSSKVKQRKWRSKPSNKTEYCNKDMKENNEKGEYKKTIRIFKMMAMENIMVLSFYSRINLMYINKVIERY